MAWTLAILSRLQARAAASRKNASSSRQSSQSRASSRPASNPTSTAIPSAPAPQPHRGLTPSAPNMNFHNPGTDADQPLDESTRKLPSPPTALRSEQQSPSETTGEKARTSSRSLPIGDTPSGPAQSPTHQDSIATPTSHRKQSYLPSIRLRSTAPSLKPSPTSSLRTRLASTLSHSQKRSARNIHQDADTYLHPLPSEEAGKLIEEEYAQIEREQEEEDMFWKGIVGGASSARPSSEHVGDNDVKGKGKEKTVEAGHKNRRRKGMYSREYSSFALTGSSEGGTGVQKGENLGKQAQTNIGTSPAPARRSISLPRNVTRGVVGSSVSTYTMRGAISTPCSKSAGASATNPAAYTGGVDELDWARERERRSSQLARAGVSIL